MQDTKMRTVWETFINEIRSKLIILIFARYAKRFKHVFASAITDAGCHHFFADMPQYCENCALHLLVTLIKAICSER